MTAPGRQRPAGAVRHIAGPVVAAVGLAGVQLYEVVHVGERRLVGEVIRLEEQRATIQVYEDTAGLRVGEPVEATGLPLAAELGPGLLGEVFDGLQRPLETLAGQGGNYIERGSKAAALDKDRRWPLAARVRAGARVEPGDVLGVVQETPAIEHRVLVPPGVRGRVLEMHAGDVRGDDVVALIGREADEQEPARITLAQRWPVRRPRPVRERLRLADPLITGTRVIDAFFPVARGGAAIIPGGFGTGKTVTEQALARWADVAVVVYVGCGERGNEMAEVLEEFPRLEDPRTGAPLMGRTVLIANTSNMPVAAREACIYTGITIAEYYRDMGYDVLLLADSTSRWGEALREISGLLEEMPAEEGYPAYLAARLAAFYERAGRVACLGRAADGDSGGARAGSVTVVGAVSPAGGDFSEPMTQNSMRLAGAFWALDTTLSRRRHFPAISWLRSYSLYELQGWFGENVAAEWSGLVQEAMRLLEHENELQEIVQLVGPEALSAGEQGVLFTARMIREDFLQQSAVHETDRFSPLEKTHAMLKTILEAHRLTKAALDAGVELEDVRGLPFVGEIARMKELPLAGAGAALAALREQMRAQFSGLGVK